MVALFDDIVRVALVYKKQASYHQHVDGVENSYGFHPNTAPSKHLNTRKRHYTPRTKRGALPSNLSIIPMRRPGKPLSGVQLKWIYEAPFSFNQALQADLPLILLASRVLHRLP